MQAKQKENKKTIYYLCKQSKKRTKNPCFTFASNAKREQKNHLLPLQAKQKVKKKGREAHQNGTDALRLSELSSVPLLTQM